MRGSDHDQDNNYDYHMIGSRREQPTPANEEHESKGAFFQLDWIEKWPVTYFAERDELAEIQRMFDDARGPYSTAVVALIGLGGSGKTQLMLQYAYSQRNSYGVVLWFDARNTDTLLKSFEDAAAQLGLIVHPTMQWNNSQGQGVVKYNRQVNADKVKKELQRRQQKWLMLFDEADDISMIDVLPKYLPVDHNGSIIISSRRKECYRLAQSTINVSKLGVESARNLLLHHARLENVNSIQLKQAVEVVEGLDLIALAIDLAGT